MTGICVLTVHTHNHTHKHNHNSQKSFTNREYAHQKDMTELINPKMFQQNATIYHSYSTALEKHITQSQHQCNNFDTKGQKWEKT